VDYNYVYASVSFAIGTAAGFQGVWERYNQDVVAAAKTLPGIVYLFSRGLLPAAVFSLLYGNGYLARLLFLQALACGTGAELVLRMTFYVKQEKQAGGFEELLRGPFDLFRWYQSFWLETIAGRMAEGRKKTVQGVILDVSFTDLVKHFSKNVGAWPNPQLMAQLEKEVLDLRVTYDKELAAGGDVTLNERYRYKLGYLILNRLGAAGLRTLLSD
jgi:hypothetical protein